MAKVRKTWYSSCREASVNRSRNITYKQGVGFPYTSSCGLSSSWRWVIMCRIYCSLCAFLWHRKFLFHLPTFKVILNSYLLSVTDLTALWNTNAFFAYIFNVLIFRLKWEPTPLLAVIIATGGVFMVVYGGAQQPHSGPQMPSTATSPLVGNSLALIASVLFGLYQVYYKRYAALPGTDFPESLPEHEPIYQHISSHADLDDDVNSGPRKFRPLPLGLYANFISSLMGLVTLLLFWIPIPILHYLGNERFSFPTVSSIYMNIAIIATLGAAFNACIMVGISFHM